MKREYSKLIKFANENMAYYYYYLFLLLLPVSKSIVVPFLKALFLKMPTPPLCAAHAIYLGTLFPFAGTLDLR